MRRKSIITKWKVIDNGEVAWESLLCCWCSLINLLKKMEEIHVDLVVVFMSKYWYIVRVELYLSL